MKGINDSLLLRCLHVLYQPRLLLQILNLSEQVDVQFCYSLLHSGGLRKVSWRNVDGGLEGNVEKMDTVGEPHRPHELLGVINHFKFEPTQPGSKRRRPPGGRLTFNCYQVSCVKD